MRFLTHSLTVLLLATQLLSACAQTPATPMAVRLLDGNAQTLRVISDETAVANLRSAWLQKQLIVFKKRPDFEYQIELSEAGANSRWWYTKGGFTTRADKADGVFYKINNVDVINKLLNLN